MSEGLHQRKTNGNPSKSSHSHSHSAFHSHTHTHDGEQHSEAGMIFEALQGRGDRGSFITLVGLFSNVALTLLKGCAGWYLNSASLIADAGHSLSDLLGDFVTLFCWRLSQQPPSERYPYGYGKFESVGTTAVSILLLAGGIGIGLHSYSLLVDALSPIITQLPPGLIRSLITSLLFISTPSDHTQATEAETDLDANAVWFPLLGIVVKEYLYRATKKVADDAGSSVLLANALHHRSDAFASVVTVVAISASLALPNLPLDPLGGIVVAILILVQGVSLFTGAIGELTDAGAPPETRETLLNAAKSFAPASQSHLVNIHSLRAVRSGALMFVDLVVEVSDTLTIKEAQAVEDGVRETIMSQMHEVKEVRIHLVAVAPRK